MPTYEYACSSCGEHIEVVQSFRDDPLTECPNCGGPLRKVFGSIGVVFKGSGFYKTDSRASSKRAKSEKAEKTESSPLSSESSKSSDSGSSSTSSSGSGDASSSTGASKSAADKGSSKNSKAAAAS